MKTLTKEEARLLDWLSKEDLNAFGECHGATLDKLVMAGLAIIQPGNPTAGYAVVSVSPKGIEVLKEQHLPHVQPCNCDWCEEAKSTR